MLDLRSLPIDPSWLQARIDELGAIGVHPNGGLYRALYTDSWVEATALLRCCMEAASTCWRQAAASSVNR